MLGKPPFSPFFHPRERRGSSNVRKKYLQPPFSPARIVYLLILCMHVTQSAAKFRLPIRQTTPSSLCAFWSSSFAGCRMFYWTGRVSFMGFWNMPSHIWLLNVFFSTSRDVNTTLRGLQIEIRAGHCRFPRLQPEPRSSFHRDQSVKSTKWTAAPMSEVKPGRLRPAQTDIWNAVFYSKPLLCISSKVDGPDKKAGLFASYV